MTVALSSKRSRVLARVRRATRRGFAGLGMRGTFAVAAADMKADLDAFAEGLVPNLSELSDPCNQKYKEHMNHHLHWLQN